MFTNYHHTVSSINTPVVLFEVPPEKTILVLDVSVSAGNSGGKLTMTVANGVSDVFSWAVNLLPEENADISPQKIRIFTEGYTLSVKGDTEGMSCYISCVEK